MSQCEYSYSHPAQAATINMPQKGVQAGLTQVSDLVLYDERTDGRAGEKFAGADLFGTLCRIITNQGAPSGRRTQDPNETTLPGRRHLINEFQINGTLL